MQRQRNSDGSYRAVPPAERFWSKVDKDAPDGCWEWTGHVMPVGYGQFRLRDRAVPAHRAAWELSVGPIAPGLHIDHLCRNPLCVNPAHLEPVTPKENTRRGLYGVLKQTCANGHPWIPENIATNGPGKQCCAICHRARVREYKRRKREERRAA